MRRPLRIVGTRLRGRGHPRRALGARRLAVAGPVHGALHASASNGALRPPTSSSRERLRAPTPSRRTAARKRAVAAEEQAVLRAAKRYRHQLARRATPSAGCACPARAERDRRRRHRSRLADERPGPLREVVRSRRRAARLHRGPPHDIRRAVRSHRAAAQGRLGHLRAPVRDLLLPRPQHGDRRPPTRSRGCARTATR